VNEQQRPLRVFYTRSRTANHRQFPANSDVLALSADQYGAHFRNLTFDVTAFVRGWRHIIGQLRLVIIDHAGKRIYLNKIAPSTTQPIEFPLSDKLAYLSLGTSIEFYQRLLDLLPHTLMTALLSLHDVIALQGSDPSNPDYQRLTKSRHFRTSLLRGTSSVQAFSEAPRLLFPSALQYAEPKFDGSRIVHKPNQRPFTVTFRLPSFIAPHRVTFDFTEKTLPSNINVIIGANGTGKTQALKHLSDYLLERGIGAPTRVKQLAESPLSSYPTFSQVIVSSFTPFDTFSSSKSDAEKRDVEYFYCGFRDANGRFRVQYAIDETARHFAAIQRHAHGDEGLPKLEIIIEILHEAFSFDDIVLDYMIRGERASYSVIRSSDPVPTLEGAEGPPRLRFIRAGEDVVLSPGQTLFVLLATAVVSVIRDESLLLIDEPELYLHPNLEVSFVRFLRRLLSLFRSYAVLATHSTIITREIPSQCVHVLRVGIDRVPTCEPPAFETFGADITRIANYVFDDPLVDLPYQEFLIRQFGERQFQELVESSEPLNLESLAFLRNRQRRLPP
jgi:predicted ATPase